MPSGLISPALASRNGDHMDKAYEPQHDKKWQELWDKAQVAKPEVSQKLHVKPTGKPFTILMPPPNVTGALHQGHALFLALQDLLTRWHRMLGDNSLYLPGTDHASISMQMQVVKRLESQGIEYRSLGREGFLKKCWEWIDEYQPRIRGQIRSIGTSCDWTREKFTMDPELNKAVTRAFVEFHKKGLVYRAEKLVNWSPKGQTVLSDLEVVFKEQEGSLWHLRYPLAHDPKTYLIVATTRPETMLGDTAVAVHPEDPRYKHLIGKTVKLPIVDREIPIVGDAFVDREFGSGAVKITPAHDFNDFEVGERHKLPKINIFTPTAALVGGLPGKAAAWAGKDRFEARKLVVAEFEAAGLLEKIDKHQNRIGTSEKWGEVVEPYLSYQWFLKMDGMAAKAKKAVESGKIEIVPHEFHNQFMRWMEGIHDWCISRQLWWGQQIPAYHCTKCAHIEVADTAPAQCAKCGGSVKQDDDVLDTWFSSGIWPISTLGWPDPQAKDLKTFFPTSILETGFDILFFWVARMVMMTLELTDEIPFEKVYMHPMVRDEHGQKMSKTKGNVIDPLEIMHEMGADSLRLTLNGLCVQGRDLRLSQERLDGYKAFINKVWNATRFVLMATGTLDGAHAESAATASAPRLDARKRPQLAKDAPLHDRWILARLDATARDLNQAWSQFRIQEATELLYHFVWNDLCDWYLECSKTSKESSAPVLVHVLGEALKMLHPIIPHVTEELWHELPGVPKEAFLAVQSFPLGEGFPQPELLAEFDFVQRAVSSVRNLRAESKVPPSKVLGVAQVIGAEARSRAALEANLPLVRHLAKVEGLSFGAAAASGPVTKVIVPAIEAGKNLEIAFALTELKDVGEEKLRLKKEIETFAKLVAAQEGKLNNKGFTDRAPPEVVDKERIKLAEYKDKLVKTEQVLKELGQ
jgi:valyl-tRNA synthetase